MGWSIGELVGGIFGETRRRESDKHKPTRDVAGRPTSAPSASVPIHVRATDDERLMRLVDDIERDTKFKLGYLSIASLVQYANVSITCQSTDPRAMELADSLREHWYATVSHMMRAFAYGRQAFEFWYCDRPTATGARLLAEINPLPFRDAKRSKKPGCNVRVGSGQDAVDLPADCSWMLTVDESAEYPDGKSRYLGAAEDVYCKRAGLERQYGSYLRKFASGIFTGRAPSQYPEGGIVGRGEVGQVGPDGMPLNPQQDLAAAITRVESGGSIIVDSAVDPATNTPLFDVAVNTVQAASAPLENRERKLDDAALESIGVPPRAVSQDAATGAYAMSETHRKILNATIEGLLTQFAAQFQEGICRPVSIVNFGRDIAFTVEWQPLEEDRSETIIELVKTMLSASAVSPLVTQGVVDVAKLFEVAAIPTTNDVAGAMLRVRDMPQVGAMPQGGALPAMPQHTSMSAAAPSNPTQWPEIADTLAAMIRERRAELASSLNGERDWGRL